MNIWIVEDSDSDADKAFTIAKELAFKEGLTIKVFRDQDILWGADITELPRLHVVSKLDYPPAIVILDLFDQDGVFRAAKFYSSLRRDEIERGRQAAFVVVWSPKTGEDEAEKFMTEVPNRDRRVAFADKTPTGYMLREAVSQCIRAWREGLYE